MSKKKLIIDVDTGTDDAQAIMLALSHPAAEVVAISCVHGNTNTDQVCLNTLRILQVCGRLDVSIIHSFYFICPAKSVSSIMFTQIIGYKQ